MYVTKDFSLFFTSSGRRARHRALLALQPLIYFADLPLGGNHSRAGIVDDVVGAFDFCFRLALADMRR